MKKILAYDCSGTCINLGLQIENTLHRDTIENTFTGDAVRNFFPTLLFFIEKFDLGINDLDVILTTKGPGSFTGVRLGLAAAQGLKLSGMKAQFFGISNFDLLTLEDSTHDGGDLLIALTNHNQQYIIRSPEGVFLMEEEALLEKSKQYKVITNDLALQGKIPSCVYIQESQLIPRLIHFYTSHSALLTQDLTPDYVVTPLYKEYVPAV